MDHRKRSSLIVVFMTHGDIEGKLYASDDDFITCEEVWKYFSADKCPTLLGKPKVFIFQACKGNQRSTIQDSVQEDSLRVETAKKNYTLPGEADILVAYSTVEGNVAFRNSESGSWFIQELCKNFTAYGRREDLVSIITRVSKCVAYKYKHKNYKQMPCFISTLTRKFYLCKSKERGFLLDLREQNNQLLSKIEKLENKVEELLINAKDKETKEKDDGKCTTDNNQRKKKISTTLKPRWK